MKREKMNARRFKALFKRQRIQEIVSGGNKLERPVNLVYGCSDNSKCLDSQSMEDMGDGGHDCSKTVVDRLTDESINTAIGALQDSTSRDDQAAVASDISVGCLRDCLVDEPRSKCSHTKSRVRDISDNPEKSPTNCPSAENKGPSESSRDGPISANCSHQEDAASASLVCKNCNPEETCLLCTKSKWGLSNVNAKELQCSSYKEETMELEFGEKSADEEHAERQILTHLKVELKGKAGASEIYDDEIKEIQKKCDKRMNQLIWKQKKQIQELLRVWENKKAELQKDHKLRSTIVRSIHGRSSAGMDRLKVLDDDLEMKIKDHNILKDAQLKNLEAEHLGVITQERQKAADWLAKVKDCCLELRVINDQLLLCSQLEDDAGGPQPHTFIDVDGDEGKPVSGQHLENDNPNTCFSRQGKDAIPSISSISAPDTTICHDTPAKSFATVKSEKVGMESFVAVELLNQSMNFIDDREGVPQNLPAPLEQVSGETKQVDLTNEYLVVTETVTNEIAGQDQHGELRHPSGEESKKVRKTSLSYDMVSSRAKPEMVASEGLHSAGQPSLGLERTVVSPDSGDLLLQKASDALGQENRSASQIEIETSEPTHSVAPVPSNLESPITDNLATSGPFSNALVNEVSGQFHSLSADVSLSCKRSPATEDNEETEVLLHEFVFRAEEDLEMNPACGVSNEQNVELPGVLHNDMGVPQRVVNAPERPNHSVSQVVDIDAGNRHGSPGFLVNPTHQPTYRNSAPSLLDPLQKQLEMICEDTEQLTKSHADTIAQLESDRRKEMEDIISQIRNRYEVKCQETRAQFSLKRNAHEKNHKKLLMNNMLADAFRSKWFETRPSADHAAAPVSDS